MLVKTLVGQNHETLKNPKKNVGDNNKLKINSEIGTIISKNICFDDSVCDLKKGYPDEFGKLGQTFNKYTSESDLKIMKPEKPDKTNYLNKNLAYPYENVNSIDAYQKPNYTFEKEDIFRKY